MGEEGSCASEVYSVHVPCFSSIILFFSQQFGFVFSLSLTNKDRTITGTKKMSVKLLPMKKNI